MLTFRKKMLLSGICLFAGFLALLFLFLDRSLDTFLGKEERICFLVRNFKVVILALGGGFLFLYSLSTWILFNRLSRPIQTISDHLLTATEGDLLTAIPLEQGEFGKMASILNSMTGKIIKQMDHLKLARKETEEILETLTEGVIAVDSQGKPTFANEAARKILGAPREDLLPSKNELAAKCREIIQDVLQTSEATRRSWDTINPVRHFEISAAPRPGHRGVILVLQDKSSDFKVLEMGKDFIANASHELRTPITIIRGFAETMQDHPELSPDILADIAEKIVRTSHRLENLVKSLLTLADIENFSKDNLQATDLVSVVERCRQWMPSAPISFTTDLAGASVLGDPHLLDMAIMNLLENAVKYSSPPGQIAMFLKKEEKEIQLTVQDRGIGIPEGDLPHIFGRFYTVDKARSRKSGGAGLGLSIVKTIVEKHMGSISVSSKLGMGSAFTIHLPLPSNHGNI